MPTVTVNFKGLIQDSQNYGSDGKHLAPHLSCEVE